MAILILNAGSSSIKISYFTKISKKLMETTQANIDLDVKPYTLKLNLNGKTELIKASKTLKIDALDELFEKLKKQLKSSAINIIGHRIVHGGNIFHKSTIINGSVKKKLEKLSPLAPLHNPIELMCIELVEKHWPKTKQVASFDTVFFNDLPNKHKYFPISKKISSKEIQRYGFHGINHKYCIDELKKILKKGTYNNRIITCHLGGGCSIAATHHNKCFDTTMGFSPLDGVMMGTRAGSIDPGIILYLLKNKKVTQTNLEEELYNKSGLLAISRYSSNVAKLLKVEKTSEKSKMALEMYVDSIAKNISSMITSIEGCDHIIFTGGVGENCWEVRQRVVKKLSYMGLELNHSNNKHLKGNLISNSKSKISIWVVKAGENLMIARESIRFI